MALGNARRKLRNAMRMEDRGWGGWRSPVLLIPRGWRASARSGWLHGVLSLTNPIFWGSLGASGAAAPLALHQRKIMFVSWSRELWPQLWGCALGAGGRRVVGTRLGHGRSRSYRKDKAEFFEKFTVCSDFSPLTLDKPLGLGAQQAFPGRFGK